MGHSVKENLFEIDSKRLELDSLQRRFVIECKRFTAQIIEGRVRYAISLNHEKAMALGKEGLKPIKKMVNHVIDDISDSVEKNFNHDALWLHTKEDLCSKHFTPGQYCMKGMQGPEILEKEVIKLLSPAGEILLQFGLDSDGNWEKKGDHLYYRHKIEWSHEMKECMEQYEELLNELSELVKEYENLSMQTEENDALELWDSL